VPTVLYADPPAEIGSLAIDADAVYLTDVLAAQVIRVPKCGGPAAPVAGPHAYNMGTALSLAVAAGNVAWIDDIGAGGDIIAGPSAPGGQARLLASIVRPLSQSIGLDCDHVYYGDGAVESLPLAGGTPSSLVPGSSGIAAVDDINVYFYQVPPTGGALASVPKSGGDVTILVPSFDGGFDSQTQPHFFQYFAQDADALYWMAERGPQSGPVLDLLRVPKSGGVPEVLVANVGPSRLLVVDDAHVYWNYSPGDGSSPGAIVRVPKTGGSVETVVTVPNAAGGASAVDARTLYWSTGHAIMKLDK
jgi:hypothetical protein